MITNRINLHKEDDPHHIIQYDMMKNNLRKAFLDFCKEKCANISGKTIPPVWCMGSDVKLFEFDNQEYEGFKTTQTQNTITYKHKKKKIKEYPPVRKYWSTITCRTEDNVFLETTYSLTSIRGYFDSFLEYFINTTLKGRVITTSDMLTFYNGVLTYMVESLLRVCGYEYKNTQKEETLPGETVKHMYLYYRKVDNESIVPRKIIVDINRVNDVGSIIESLSNTSNIYVIKQIITESNGK